MLTPFQSDSKHSAARYSEIYTLDCCFVICVNSLKNTSYAQSIFALLPLSFTVIHFRLYHTDIICCMQILNGLQEKLTFSICVMCLQ